MTSDRTQKDNVATKHLSNSRKIFLKLFEISESIDESKMNAMISEQDCEELDLYIVKFLLGDS